MRKLLVLMLCVAAMVASSVAAAQSSRVDAIMGHAMDRMVRQTDIWFDDGDFPRAISTLWVMHGLYPSDYEIATNLGWMLQNIESDDQALALYIAYRKRHPNNAEAAYPEANYYFMKRAYSKVPPLIEPTIKYAQKPHPNSYRILAHSYERIGFLEDSKRVWEIYIKLAPDDAAAKNNLARVERKLKGEGGPPPQNRSG